MIAQFFNIVVRVCSVSFLFSAYSFADTITLSFPVVDPAEDLLTPKAPATQLVSQSLASPLISLSEQGSIIPVLCDAVRVSPNGRHWEIRLRNESQCADATPVTYEDINFSFEGCPELNQVKLSKRFSQGRTFITVTLPEDRENNLQMSLARCPILKATTSKIFGSSLGKDLHYVGCGPYVVDVVRESKIVLRPIWASITAQIMLREIKDSKVALSTLRSGSVDAAFGLSLEDLGRVQQDPTLKVSQCLGHTVASRKDLDLPCTEDRIVASSIRYPR